MESEWWCEFEKETSKKAHLTSWAESAQRKKLGNLKKARLINDVRYQEWTEMTLDYKKMVLIVTEEAVVKGHFARRDAPAGNASRVASHK